MTWNVIGFTLVVSAIAYIVVKVFDHIVGWDKKDE